jgi:hypothetical protein
VEPAGAVSVIRSSVWPLKRRSMRGVVLGVDAATLAASAVGSVLPGLHAVGEGDLPPLGATAHVVAEAPGAWVVRQG